MLGAGVPPVGIPTHPPADGTSVASVVLMIVFVTAVALAIAIQVRAGRRNATGDRDAGPDEEVEPRQVEELLAR
ncbi:MAG TPA: hypothetical protein VF195_13515 [Actinomycetota bacterium]